MTMVASKHRCGSKPAHMVARVLVGISISALLTACQTTPWRASDGVVPRDEVVRLFVGNTVESYNLNTRLISFTYYHPDGTALQERLWKRRKGSWQIRDDGQICLAFGKRALKCRHIVHLGGRYFKERVDENGKPERIVKYRYFAAGNALNSGRDG